MLATYDWVYGSCQIGSVILSLIAGGIPLTLFKSAHRRKPLRAWKFLIWALVFFALVELAGALKTFGVWSTPWLTHVIPGIILAFLITALVIQIQVTRGYE